MNRAEVMRLAREAGVHALEANDALAPFLERFADLVAIRALKLGQPIQPDHLVAGVGDGSYDAEGWA